MIKSKLKIKMLSISLLCIVLLVTIFPTVQGFWKDTDGKNYVVAYGNDVDGTIAAVKKLVSGKDLFLNTGAVSWDERTVIIDDFDITGLSVMDLFHSIKNKK